MQYSVQVVQPSDTRKTSCSSCQICLFSIQSYSQDSEWNLIEVGFWLQPSSSVCCLICYARKDATRAWRSSQGFLARRCRVSLRKYAPVLPVSSYGTQSALHWLTTHSLGLDKQRYDCASRSRTEYGFVAWTWIPEISVVRLRDSPRSS